MGTHCSTALVHVRGYGDAVHTLHGACALLLLLQCPSAWAAIACMQHTRACKLMCMDCEARSMTKDDAGMDAWSAYLHHVLADSLNLLQITTHLVVQLCEPIGHPELEAAAGLGQLVHIDGLHHTLSNVHATRRLEAIVGDDSGLLGQQVLKLLIVNALLSNAPAQLEALLQSQAAGVRGLLSHGQLLLDLLSNSCSLSRHRDRLL